MHAALLVAAGGSVLSSVGTWVLWHVIGQSVIGVVVGVLLGRALGSLAFRARSSALRLAERGEPLLALAVLLTAYGAAELLHGYGFLAVFASAMALRAAEHRHDYHRAMHEVVQRLELLLTLVFLLMLGIAFTSGLLEALDLRGVLVGCALVLVVRPLTAWAALTVAARPDPQAGGLAPRGRHAVAFLGVRGVGSIFYLAWALGERDWADADWLWATVAFSIGLSVLVHGVAATPTMRRLDDEPETGTRAGAEHQPSTMQPDSFAATVDPSDGVLRVSGAVDEQAAESLRDTIGVVGPRTPHLVVDLSEVTFLPSFGVGVLASAVRLATADGRRLELVARSGSTAQRVLEICALPHRAS